MNLVEVKKRMPPKLPGHPEQKKEEVTKIKQIEKVRSPGRRRSVCDDPEYNQEKERFTGPKS